VNNKNTFQSTTLNITSLKNMWISD